MILNNLKKLEKLVNSELASKVDNSSINYGELLIEIKVEELISKLLRSSRDIESVWLYDWIDARNIAPLINMPANSIDLLPTGYWMEGDEYVIGHFVLGQCTSLDRDTVNIACSVMSAEDSWGFVLVQYIDGVTPDLKTTKATAMRISEILYLIERN